MSESLIEGNTVELYENGDEFFPAVIAAIDEARQEVLIETFIFRNDTTGTSIRDALVRAAGRHVHIVVVADGFGSAGLDDGFIRSMLDVGITFLMYDPQPSILWIRHNWLRRLHRKLIAIDNCKGFAGGINITDEQVTSTDLASCKQDYAAGMQGPVVNEIRALMYEMIREGCGNRCDGPSLKGAPPVKDGKSVRLVGRDNHKNRRNIEKAFVKAIHSAKHEIIIANAYFLPGYQFLRALRKAARRGVQVKLILAGKTDSLAAQFATRALYDFLLRSRIRIFEYGKRELHAKIAVIDGHWTTVGSSNLDPTSLALNIEANVIVEDEAFCQRVKASIDKLIVEDHALPVNQKWIHKRIFLRAYLSFLLFHFLRLFPKWASRLPDQPVRLKYRPGGY